MIAVRCPKNYASPNAMMPSPIATITHPGNRRDFPAVGTSGTGNARWISPGEESRTNSVGGGTETPGCLTGPGALGRRQRDRLRTSAGYVRENQAQDLMARVAPVEAMRSIAAPPLAGRRIASAMRWSHRACSGSEPELQPSIRLRLSDMFTESRTEVRSKYSVSITPRSRSVSNMRIGSSLIAAIVAS